MRFNFTNPPTRYDAGWLRLVLENIKASVNAINEENIVDPLNGDAILADTSVSNSKLVSPGGGGGGATGLLNTTSSVTLPTSTNESFNNNINLHKVSKTGKYSDLIGLPSISSVGSSGQYSDLLGKPSFASVAFTGSYLDLVDVPSFANVAFSGDFNDLINKPLYPTKTSDLENDSNFAVDTNYVHTDNNYTTDDKNKLSGIEAGAEVNVQSDWTQSDNTADDYIKNKPTIPTKTSDLTNDSNFVNQTQLDTKVDKVTGKGLSTEDYTTTEKNKLAGIANNANNYVHPANHSPSIITQDANNRFVTDSEKSAWNAKQAALVSGTNIKTINSNSVLGSGDIVLPTASSTTTFTNKRIDTRTTAVASSATPTPNIANEDEYILTALAADATFGSPSGTPVQGQKLLIRIKDDGVGTRALFWNAIYRAGTELALPSITTLGKTMVLGFIYNSTDSKWDLVGFVNGL